MFIENPDLKTVVDPQHFGNVMTEFIINKRTDA